MHKVLLEIQTDQLPPFFLLWDIGGQCRQLMCLHFTKMKNAQVIVITLLLSFFFSVSLLCDDISCAQIHDCISIFGCLSSLLSKVTFSLILLAAYCLKILPYLQKNFNLSILDGIHQSYSAFKDQSSFNWKFHNLPLSSKDIDIK